MLKWLVGTVAGAVLGIGGYFTWYLGAWKPVSIREESKPALYLLYKDHMGPYHKISPVIMEVEEWAKAHHVPCVKTFGEYLDDPRSVEEGRLRSRGGCIYEGENPIAKFNLEADLKSEERAAHNYVVAVFEGSPAIGPMKVYSKVEDYFNAKNIKMASWTIEIYEVHSEKSMTTTYLFPL